MTIEDLIELARAKMTPEKRERMAQASRDLLRRRDKEEIACNRCSECGVDTLHYSHTFKCSQRGL